METTTDRKIEILEHKIIDLGNKINSYNTFGISNKKIERLEILKFKYEQQLEELITA